MEMVTTKKNGVSPSLTDLSDMVEDLAIHDVGSDKYILSYMFGESFPSLALPLVGCTWEFSSPV